MISVQNLLQQLNGSDMTDNEQKLHQAGQYLEEGKYLHAIQIYYKLLESSEYKRKALIKLVEIYDKQNQTQSAVKVFEDYLRENSADSNMRTFFAQFLIRKKEYNYAHEILSTVSKQENPEKNFLMGLVNFYLEDYEVAEINFSDYVDQNKTSDLLVDAYLYSAKCNIKMQNYDKALQKVQLTESIDKSNFESYFIYARVFYHKEMYFHASENIQKAIKLNPTNHNLYELSGKIFYKIGEYNKAEKEIRNYLNNSEPNSESYAFLGIILKELKRYKEALEYFNLALKINPRNKIAKQEQAYCKLKLK